MQMLYHRMFEVANNDDRPSLELSCFREQVIYQMVPDQTSPPTGEPPADQPAKSRTAKKAAPPSTFSLSTVCLDGRHLVAQLARPCAQRDALPHLHAEHGQPDRTGTAHLRRSGPTGGHLVRADELHPARLS